MKRDVYQAVTDRMIAALEEGTVPWHKPWKCVGGPVNIRSGKRYRGINVPLLTLEDYRDPRWGTFKAIHETAARHATHEGREIVEEVRVVKGYPKKTFCEIVNGEKVPFRGGVRKGEKGTYIILWKPVRKNAGEDNEESYLLLRDYVVFNAEQADGLPPLPDNDREHTPIERAEEIVSGYVWSEGTDNVGPPILYGYDEACYVPSKDVVRVPAAGAFESDEAFYSTVFHELVHSTGHEKRLGRLEPALFGTDPYSKEELVAEMGAAFLNGIAELDLSQQEAQSAAYIANWLGKLRDDKRLVVQASAQAQKAVDMILGESPAEMVEERPLAEVAA